MSLTQFLLFQIGWMLVGVNLFHKNHFMVTIIYFYIVLLLSYKFSCKKYSLDYERVYKIINI